MSSSSSYAAPLGTHEKADKSVVYEGQAAIGKGVPLAKWGYNPRPLGDDDVEIKITHCGICGSDLHTQDSGWGPTMYPCITGHEIVGSVVAVGKNVTNFAAGDRVGVGAQVGSCLQADCEACGKGMEQHCARGNVFTYNSLYPDGQQAHGGYATGVRVHSHFTFKIPENIDSASAAPLLCAGATVYAPLARYQAGPGKKVAVIGIGGLGHLAIQFASKMGAEVTAVSTSSRKKDDALKLGAHHFLDMSDDEAKKSSVRKFDIIICTANGSDMDTATYLTFVSVGGYFVAVAAPEKPWSVHPFSILMSRVHFCASLIASHSEMKQMLEFASKHGVKAWTESFPLDQANEAVQKVRDNKMRYRVVLEVPQN